MDKIFGYDSQIIKVPWSVQTHCNFQIDSISLDKTPIAAAGGIAQLVKHNPSPPKTPNHRHPAQSSPGFCSPRSSFAQYEPNSGERAVGRKSASFPLLSSPPKFAFLAKLIYGEEVIMVATSSATDHTPYPIKSFSGCSRWGEGRVKKSCFLPLNRVKYKNTSPASWGIWLHALGKANPASWRMLCALDEPVS